MPDTLERDTERERAAARREFYRIVAERLDARFARNETYTTTTDLYRGYERLHGEGFDASVPPSQSVAQVLAYSRYRGRLFYARDCVTHRAERSGKGRTASYRLYLRPDATPPKGHVLVGIGIRGEEAIGQAIAVARGLSDPTVHVTQTAQTASSAPHTPEIDFEAIAERLTAVIQAQAAVIDTMVPALSALINRAA